MIEYLANHLVYFLYFVGAAEIVVFLLFFPLTDRYLQHTLVGAYHKFKRDEEDYKISSRKFEQEVDEELYAKVHSYRHPEISLPGNWTWILPDDLRKEDHPLKERESAITHLATGGHFIMRSNPEIASPADLIAFISKGGLYTRWRTENKQETQWTVAVPAERYSDSARQTYDRMLSSSREKLAIRGICTRLDEIQPIVVTKHGHKKNAGFGEFQTFSEVKDLL